MTDLLSTTELRLDFVNGVTYIGGVDAHTWLCSRFRLHPSSTFSFKDGMVAACAVSESLVVAPGTGHEGEPVQADFFGTTPQMWHCTDILDCWVRWLTALCSAIKIECKVVRVGYFHVVLRLMAFEDPVPNYRDPFPAILRTPRKPLPAKFRNRHKRGQQR